MMEGLGRVVNVVPIAAGTLISMKDCAGITFVVTGDDMTHFAGNDEGQGFFIEAQCAHAAIDHHFPRGAGSRTRIALVGNDEFELVDARLQLGIVGEGRRRQTACQTLHLPVEATGIETS